MPRHRGDGQPMHQLMLSSMPVFTLANHKFSTSDPGRPSTFYFQDMAGARGRYRRAHAGGAQLIAQGRCRRCFLAPMLKDQLSALTTGHVFEDNLDWNTYGDFMGKLVDVLDVLEDGDPDGRYAERAALHMRAGWHVFDFNGNEAHCSSGTVIAVDPDVAGFFAGGGFTGYQGRWTVW